MDLKTTLSAQPPTGATPITPINADALSSGDRLSLQEARFAAAQGFTGAVGETALLPEPSGSLARVVFGVAGDGCGVSGDGAPHSAPDPVPDPWALAGLPPKLPPGGYMLSEDLDDPLMTVLATGWALAQYRFDRYTNKDALAPRVLHVPPHVAAEATRRAVAAALVRDLVNTPTEDMGPLQLEQVAHTLAAMHDGTRVEVIEGPRLQEGGFPLIHAVGRAASADRAPRLIDLRWQAATTPDDAPLVTLVGKGVCFDTGGLDLKPSKFMRNMKKDMGGAAHALGLAMLIMDRGLPVRLRVLIPAVENSVAGNAFRPGDVFKSRAGITVEIDNTDAEGRLILADALAYAQEGETASLLLNMATLTGAARVALGPDLPACFTPDTALWADLEAAQHRTGDPLWRLPLHQAYLADLDSTVADIANAGASGLAGAITAALFLQKFMPDCPWLHMDVFAWSNGQRPGRPKGGAAQGLFTLYEVLLNRFEGD